MPHPRTQFETLIKSQLAKHLDVTKDQAQDLPTMQNAGMQLEMIILDWLARIEAKIDALSQEKTIQEYYDVSQFAERVNRRKYTVRQWCLNGRIASIKRMCGRGKSLQYSISHTELIRYFSHGLLPNPRDALLQKRHSDQ